MGTTLQIVEERQTYKFRLAWFEDGDEGGYLGQAEADGCGPAPADRDAWEHWSASRAVARLRGTERDSVSFFWDSHTHAKTALATARLALKQERALPDWAVKALANGWKAPKGWKP